MGRTLVGKHGAQISLNPLQDLVKRCHLHILHRAQGLGEVRYLSPSYTAKGLVAVLVAV